MSMKKYLILGIIIMLFGSLSAQKKELRKAGNELDKGDVRMHYRNACGR